MHPLISIQFAERSAWRAVYVYLRGAQVFHLGVDPNIGRQSRGPEFFGGLPMARLAWRLPLPAYRWRYPMNRLQRAVFNLSQRFWHAVDGRRQY